MRVFGKVFAVDGDHFDAFRRQAIQGALVVKTVPEWDPWAKCNHVCDRLTAHRLELRRGVSLQHLNQVVWSQSEKFRIAQRVEKQYARYIAASDERGDVLHEQRGQDAGIEAAP